MSDSLEELRDKKKSIDLAIAITEKTISEIESVLSAYSDCRFNGNLLHTQKEGLVFVKETVSTFGLKVVKWGHMTNYTVNEIKIDPECSATIIEALESQLEIKKAHLKKLLSKINVNP